MCNFLRDVRETVGDIRAHASGETTFDGAVWASLACVVSHFAADHVVSLRLQNHAVGLANIGERLLFRRFLLPGKLLELRLQFICEMIKGRGARSCNIVNRRCHVHHAILNTYSPARSAVHLAVGG